MFVVLVIPADESNPWYVEVLDEKLYPTQRAAQDAAEAAALAEDSAAPSMYTWVPVPPFCGMPELDYVVSGSDDHIGYRVIALTPA